MTKVICIGQFTSSQREELERLRRRCKTIFARIIAYAKRFYETMREVNEIALKYNVRFDWIRPLRSMMYLTEVIMRRRDEEIAEAIKGKSLEEARRIRRSIRRKYAKEIAICLRNYYITRALAQRIRILANEGVIRGCYLLEIDEKLKREVEEILKRLT